MSKHQRLIAALLCAVTVLALLVSSACLISAAGHCCARENCEICENVLRAQAVLRLIARFLPALTVLALLLRACACVLSAGQCSFRGVLTLIGRKVRLNN